MSDTASNNNDDGGFQMEVEHHGSDRNAQPEDDPYTPTGPAAQDVASEGDDDDNADEQPAAHDEKPFAGPTVTEPEDDAADAASHKSGRRKKSVQSSNGLLGGDHRSESGVSRGRLGRSPSFIAAEFNDDTAREKNHLRDANANLQDRVRALRQQVSDLRSQGLSRDAQRNMEQLEADNEVIRKDIAALRAKVQAASSVETLDNLTDELSGREADLKAITIRVKDVSEENYANAKLVKQHDKHPEQNPQAVFLDLKNERRRFQKRLDKTRSGIEKSREAHEAIAARLREMEEKQTELGLAELTHDMIVTTEKTFKANNEKIEKLKRKLVSFEGTFAVRSMQTTRKSAHLAEEVTELQQKVRAVEAQVLKIEQNIMQNQRLRERPPHFIEPLEMKTPPTVSLAGTYQNQPGSPRPQKPSQPPPTVSPRSKQTVEKQQSAAAPAGAPKKKKVVAPPAKPKPKPKATTTTTTAKKADPVPAEKKVESAPAAEEASDEGKLNDLNDTHSTPPRSPTPPQRSPTPPADDEDEYKEESYNPTPTPPRTPTPQEEPAKRTPTPPEEPKQRTPTPPRTPTPADEPVRTPTPPEEPKQRTPTPPADEEAPKSPAPPSEGRPDSSNPRTTPPAANDDDDNDGYGDDDFASEGSPKKDGDEPAFLTE